MVRPSVAASGEVGRVHYCGKNIIVPYSNIEQLLDTRLSQRQ